MNNPDHQAVTNRRKQITGNMGTGVALGIVFGTALENIAIGLTLGIFLGGIGSVWRISVADTNHEENDGIEG